LPSARLEARGPATTGAGAFSRSRRSSGLLLAEAVTRFIEVEGWTGIDLSRTALQVAAVDTLVALVVPVPLLERGHRAAGWAAAAAVAVVGAAVVAGLVLAIRGALFAA
jgi:hypothetical protein